MYNFTKILWFELPCRNAQMKSYWFTLDLCLEASNNKYFLVIVDDVGDQVSSFIYLFCESPPTKILNFNLSRLPLDCMFAL